MVHYGTAFNNPINHVASSCSSYTGHFMHEGHHAAPSNSYMLHVSCALAFKSQTSFHHENKIMLWSVILYLLCVVLLLPNPKSHSTMSEIMLCPTILTCHALLVPLLPNPSSHSTTSEIIMMLCLAILTCCALLALLLPLPNLPWAAPLETILSPSEPWAVPSIHLRFLGLCSPPRLNQWRCAVAWPWVSWYLMISLNPMKFWMLSFCLGLWDNMDLPWKHHHRAPHTMTETRTMRE